MDYIWIVSVHMNMMIYHYLCMVYMDYIPINHSEPLIPVANPFPIRPAISALGRSEGGAGSG